MSRVAIQPLRPWQGLVVASVVAPSISLAISTLVLQVLDRELSLKSLLQIALFAPLYGVAMGGLCAALFLAPSFAVAAFFRSASKGYMGAGIVAGLAYFSVGTGLNHSTKLQTFLSDLPGLDLILVGFTLVAAPRLYWPVTLCAVLISGALTGWIFYQSTRVRPPY